MHRAAQLAEVAAAVYDKGGAGIRLPLDADHPLVAVIHAAVRKEQVRLPIALFPHNFAITGLLLLSAGQGLAACDNVFHLFVVCTAKACFHDPFASAGWQEEHRRTTGTAAAGGSARCQRQRRGSTHSAGLPATAGVLGIHVQHHKDGGAIAYMSSPNAVAVILLGLLNGI